MTPLDSRWLNTFRVLCAEGHFTRTANRLNMTQPGVSQHLAKLEGQVGRKLVDRDASVFTLTEAGQALRSLADARWREEEALREAMEAVHEDEGTVRVASSGSFAMLLYPSIVDWMGDAPDLRAELTAAPLPRICEGVLAGEFDIGIVTAPFRHPRMERTSLGHEPLDLLLPSSWQGINPTFEDLQSLGFVNHPDGKAYADIVFGANFADEYPGPDGLSIRSAINQIGQIPAAVAAGQGYTILPRSGVITFAHADRLSITELGRSSSLPLQAIYQKGRMEVPRFAKLMRLVKAHAARLDIAETRPPNI